ncbi:hypothetical protein LIS82_08230 [Cytobacillus solani]|uniref:hypothetical protein n=1 Tax=Cytobacillus solani TaxID=1637975 RepID=UPI00207A24D8|nr:hypothetical protein [Cytobacillus solani]USK56442.1 hypothetical protein LIS82_08230 [Cytobacillus solani]
MRKIRFILVLTFFLIMISTISVFAQEEKEMDCERKKDIRNKEFNEQVMNDIFTSFGHKYNEIIDQSMYINMIDLMKYTVLTGKQDKQLEHLKDHIGGESIGEKRIYFFHGDPNTAYVFYKDKGNNNTVIHLKREENDWIVLDEQVKKGKKIQYIREKCEDDYFMKRMFHNLYPE